ncbi:MAG TPA: ABC-F family ATP-binding cassette domain-containing protein [Bacteroidales bacterium]|jgi:ATP-binding cassette subfamily F protein 3|nr:ABC-F family ATP-binding cassette domain-containing protein [Bacteroidales bacterium]
MITLSNISIGFNGEILFKEISFVVGDRDRIGLVGKNGAGKSTLLKIIHGLLEPESGTMIITSGHKTGYLPQEMVANFETTVWEEAMNAFTEQMGLLKKIDHTTRELSERSDYESESYIKLTQQLADANERFHLIGGHTMEAETEKVLLGLGFPAQDFDRPLKEYSSGWQMRVALAKILLQKPEILLLDEPTNHLDIESIQWLEEYLANYDGALLLVSHDRTFLDRVTNRTVEITLGTIQDYKCSYSEYVQQRMERIEIQSAAYENQQKEIAQIERFIERFRYKATKAKQAQSRVKMLEKMELIEVDELDQSSISFQFPPAPHSGKVTVETEDLNLGYGDLQVLKQVNFHLKRGEKVAFVGKNGEGKSTMVKAIVGELEPQQGEIRLGHQVVIGYYAQNQALLLDPKKTVFETIDHVAVGDVRTKIRTILGRFLFTPEDSEKRVGVLSGGEKSRLALAKLLLSPFNLLILDEPTNHLDMQSKNVLKNALLQYEGSMILVSHDRDFLDGLIDRIVEFKNHQIHKFIGDLHEFLEKKKLDNLKELEIAQKNKTREAKTPGANKIEYEKRKEREAARRKVQNRLNRLEKEIEELHTRLAEIEAHLEDPITYAQQIADGSLYKQYEEIKTLVEEKEFEWLELHEEELD